MWLVLLVFLCTILAVSFPGYALIFALLPALIGFLLFALSCAWDERLFLIFIGPILAIALFSF